MRIDDENKVVWCSDKLFNTHKKEIVCSTRYDTIFVAIKLYKKGIIDGFFETQIEFEEYLKAILDGFLFKIEQPQNYYWRKKKEHLVWFEKIEDSYLVRFKFSGEVDYSYTLGEVGSTPIEMTEKEARNLLKEDFDKFEKVECE